MYFVPHLPSVIFFSVKWNTRVLFARTPTLLSAFWNCTRLLLLTLNLSRCHLRSSAPLLNVPAALDFPFQQTARHRALRFLLWLWWTFSVCVCAELIDRRLNYSLSHPPPLHRDPWAERSHIDDALETVWAPDDIYLEPAALARSACHTCRFTVNA